MKIIFSILIITFFTGCNFADDKKNSEKNNFFQTSQNIKSELFISSNLLYDPWDIEVTDSLILIGNMKGEPILEIYDVSGRLITKTLKRGKKMDQVKVIGGIQISSNSDNFYIYDLLGSKILSLAKNLNRVNTDTTPKQIFKIDSLNKYNYYKLLRTKYDYFIGESKILNGRIVVLDKKAKPLSYYLKFPPKESSITSQANINIYSSDLILSPNGNHLGLVTLNCDRINLLKVNPNGLDSVWSAYSSIPNDIHFEKEGEYMNYYLTSKTKRGYIDLAATDKYFFSLYSGNSVGNKDKEFINVVRVVSWDGKIRFELIPDRSIKRIAVSNDNKILYAITENKNGFPEILKFDLNLK